MDDATPRWVMRLGIVFAVLFLFSCFKSCQEVNFRTRGKQTTGQVAGIRQESSRRGTVTYRVVYEFFNENSKDSVTSSTPIGSDEVAEYLPGQTVDIEYYGDGITSTTRIKGSGTLLWPAFLVISVAAMAIATVVLTLQAQKQHQPSRSVSKSGSRSPRR